MSKVLVIEDDAAILRGLADNLGHEGYEVFSANNGETGYGLQRSQKPDMIILDLMLPRMSGLELCRKLRAEGVQTPILMLTARSEESDRVIGLDLGADDYVTKPFSLRELMARVRALLRRTHAAAELPDELKFGEVEVDFRRYVATRRGKPVGMTRKEFATLRLLVARAGEVVTREELLNEVWGYESYPSAGLSTTMLQDFVPSSNPTPAHPVHIRTVHGVGYKFVHNANS